MATRLRSEEIRVPVTLDEAQSGIDLVERILREIDQSERTAEGEVHRAKIARARSIWGVKLAELVYHRERLRAGDPEETELTRALARVAKLERDLAEKAKP